MITVAAQPSRMTTLLKKPTTKLMKIGGSQFQLLTCFPLISHTLLYEIVPERLHYHEICARWVPKVLTEGGNAAYNISLNVPSAVEQRRAEIPGSHCDW